mmetsp:Transcript_5136/g.15237  ORF Transcript_5136/g.15237 Transcript_5136/m.15237 type:complete len:437 (-) Transcript_5136:89-1399(-)
MQHRLAQQDAARKVGRGPVHVAEPVGPAACWRKEGRQEGSDGNLEELPAHARTLACLAPEDHAEGPSEPRGRPLLLRRRRCWRRGPALRLGNWCGGLLAVKRLNHCLDECSGFPRNSQKQRRTVACSTVPVHLATHVSQEAPAAKGDGQEVAVRHERSETPGHLKCWRVEQVVLAGDGVPQPVLPLHLRPAVVDALQDEIAGIDSRPPDAMAVHDLLAWQAVAAVEELEKGHSAPEPHVSVDRTHLLKVAPPLVWLRGTPDGGGHGPLRGVVKHLGVADVDDRADQPREELHRPLKGKEPAKGQTFTRAAEKEAGGELIGGMNSPEHTLHHLLRGNCPTTQSCLAGAGPIEELVQHLLELLMALGTEVDVAVPAAVIEDPVNDRLHAPVADLAGDVDGPRAPEPHGHAFQVRLHHPHAVLVWQDALAPLVLRQRAL